MIKYIVIYVALIASFQAGAQSPEACRPDYQLQYEACKTTDTVTGNKSVLKTRRIVDGACEPDVEALCKAYPKENVIKGYDVRPEDVAVTRAYHKDAVGKFCGDISNLRAKVDVFCDFQFQAPIKEKVTDESCPISGVKDRNECYGEEKKEITISLDAINSCLDLQPNSLADLWVKSTCLVDAHKAQNSFRLRPDLPSKIYDRIRVQMDVLMNYPTPWQIRRFLQAETDYRYYDPSLRE